MEPAAGGALFALGADYASDSDSNQDGDADGGGTAGAGGSNEPAKKKARTAGSVGFRAMDLFGRSNYKRGKYEQAKAAAQDDWFVTYGSWLTKNALYGAHCKFCLPSKRAPGDKLSTTGHAFAPAVDGGEQVALPIPSEQKLKLHEAHELHKYNVERATVKSKVCATLASIVAAVTSVCSAASVCQPCQQLMPAPPLSTG